MKTSPWSKDTVINTALATKLVGVNAVNALALNRGGRPNRPLSFLPLGSQGQNIKRRLKRGQVRYDVAPQSGLVLKQKGKRRRGRNPNIFTLEGRTGISYQIQQFQRPGSLLSLLFTLVGPQLCRSWRLLRGKSKFLGTTPEFEEDVGGCEGHGRQRGRSVWRRALQLRWRSARILC